MDQDLDEAETLRVRLASSHTSTSKAAPRAHLQSADADMDVLSLVRFPFPFPEAPLPTMIMTNETLEPHTRRGPAGRSVRTTHETMGERRGRREPPWCWRQSGRRSQHWYGRIGWSGSHGSSAPLRWRRRWCHRQVQVGEEGRQ